MSDLVQLKNGSEELRPLTMIIIAHLRKLMDEGKGIILYELVELCRNPDHVPWGKQIGEDLKELNLATTDIEGRWHVHDSIRNIVLSSTTGEGMNLMLVNPIKE